jgi:hypothetical protein
MTPLRTLFASATKSAMKWLALLVAIPLVAFMITYSLDAGCFICLYGEEEGGAAEKWVNVGLVAAIVVTMASLLWRRRRR